MRRLFQILTFVTAATLVVGCGEKKRSDIIIANRPEKSQPQKPISMQRDSVCKDIVWMGKNYQVLLKRVPDDSLQMVKDENGQKFIDNRVTLRIVRADGSVFLSRSFTKASFEKFLDEDYRRTGILEGFVYDRVDDSRILFAASVCHPQTDEYIPLVVTVSSLGEVGIRLDNEMDTNGDNGEQ